MRNLSSVNLILVISEPGCLLTRKLRPETVNDQLTETWTQDLVRLEDKEIFYPITITD